MAECNVLAHIRSTFLAYTPDFSDTSLELTSRPIQKHGVKHADRGYSGEAPR
jgi:hypothetical protein